DGYVLLLVLVSIFIGGTLILLSGILIICRRCCETDRRYSRASDDPEKTNTTYLEESQPPQVFWGQVQTSSFLFITIKVDESDCLSTSSYHDVETERFLSTCSTGRRVSFNEASLFDHGKKTQEKGRRYTLTEGDFHHLKNARLTHLHVPPPVLKIVTIHECESRENNSIPMTTRGSATSKSNLSIFQPGGAILTSHPLSPSSALPGDMLNSTVDTSFIEVSPSPSAESGDSASIEVIGGSSKGNNSGGGVSGAEAAAPLSQGAVLQFFTKLRRHAILQFYHIFLKFKHYGLSSQKRITSVVNLGSPKRRQFQRQRAASESMDREDQDPHQTDIIQYIAHTDDVAFCPSPPPFLPPSSSPSPSLGRYSSVDDSFKGSLKSTPTSRLDAAEIAASSSEGAERRESSEQQTIYRDIWNLRASLELYASSDQSSNDKDSVRSDADSVCSMGGLPSYPSQDDSVESERGSDGESSTRKLLQMDSGYASIEVPSRLPEDSRIFGAAAKDKTASEKTRDYLHRRDYSIDEKTDALFNEFLRHDPQFDDSPLKSKHRSRIHLRKQWQRTKQYSDPGVRYPSAFERHRTPLRRGDSVNYPLDNRYHSTLPRIVSAADEESNEGCCGTDNTSSPTSKLMDKLTTSIEDRLYTNLKKSRDSPDCVVVVAHASPDHSPV
uniref:CACN subunit beta associated regulatory protein n=1 Tax=Latimeria chalumnae TaxID=7897 RepID=H3ARK3_LATCH